MCHDIGYVYDLTNVVGVHMDRSGLLAEDGWKALKGTWTKSNQLGLFYDRTLTFVNVPTMTHLTFGRNNLKFTVDVGTHLGYLISESAKSNFGDWGKYQGVVTRQHDMPVENKLAWG